MVFSEFTLRYQDTILCFAKPASRVTIGSHLRTLNGVFGIRPLSDLSYQDLQGFFSEASKTRSPKTVRDIWSSLRAVLRQAKREGLITEVPEIILPKCRRLEQDWFTVSQMRAIIQVAEERDQLLYALLAETGLRIGEALALKNSDIDIGHKTLTVRRSVYAGNFQSPKTDSSLRTICISSRLRNFIGGYSDEELMFPGPPPISTALMRFHKILIKVGHKPCGFHAFRRGNATLLANKLHMPESILARRLGHTLRSMTFGVYAQHEHGDDRPWIEKLGKILLGK